MRGRVGRGHRSGRGAVGAGRRGGLGSGRRGGGGGPGNRARRGASPAGEAPTVWQPGGDIEVGDGGRAEGVDNVRKPQSSTSPRGAHQPVGVAAPASRAALRARKHGVPARPHKLPGPDGRRPLAGGAPASMTTVVEVIVVRLASQVRTEVTRWRGRGGGVCRKVKAMVLVLSPIATTNTIVPLIRSRVTTGCYSDDARCAAG